MVDVTLLNHSSTYVRIVRQATYVQNNGYMDYVSSQRKSKIFSES